MKNVLPQFDNLKIVCLEDCGNAPKKLLLRDFNIAFARGDVDTIVQNISDDVCWEMIGDKRLEGIRSVTEELEQMKEFKATELHLTSIITHGATASADGILHFPDGSRYAFSDVYRFTSAGKQAKIKEIRSYVIRLD